MGNPVYSIIWLLIFIFISFFVAGFCAFWYILFYALTPCIPALQSLADILLSGLQFPNYCAKAMLEGKGF